MRKKRSAKATYEVGYGKPPKDRQFQKGKSSNLGGRRKKPASMPEVLQEELNQEITIRRNGKEQTTTKMQAAVAGLVNTAIAGEMSAFRVFIHALSEPLPRLLRSDDSETRAPPAIFRDLHWIDLSRGLPNLRTD